MLILTRKLGEKIVIDERTTVTVKRICGGRVALAFEAPSDVRILRQELKPFDAPYTPSDHHEGQELCIAGWTSPTLAK